MDKKLFKPKSQRSGGVYLATVVLVISLILVVVTFFRLVTLAGHEQRWTALATDAQVTSQQLAKSAGEAASGNLDAFLELGTSRTIIAAAMNTLRNQKPLICPCRNST